MGGATSQPHDYSSTVLDSQIERSANRLPIGKQLVALGIVLALYASMSKRGVVLFFLFVVALSGVFITIASQSWAWGFLTGALVTLLAVEIYRQYRR